MFEDSLFSSQARPMSPRTRWTLALSVAAQACTLAGALVFPLLWPATLPVVSAAPRTVTIALQHAEIKPQPAKPVPVHMASSTALRAPSADVVRVETPQRSGTIARTSIPSLGDAPPTLALGGPMATPFTLGAGTTGRGPATGVEVVRAAPRSTGPVRISSGVSAGMLLAPIRPTYPRIAIAARLEGSVLLTATIDRSGRIVGLQVLSGPPMLRTAAVDAVQAARYKPYSLNGEATDVITTIAVTFRLNGSA